MKGIRKLHVFKRAVPIVGMKRKGKGNMLIPPRGYKMNIASGFMEEKPKGRLNMASGHYEKE